MHIVKASRFLSSVLKAVHKPNVCRNYISQTGVDRDRHFLVGDKLFDYTVEHVVPVSELSLTAIHLQHRTGAQHLHIARQDNNNVFGVALRTTPRDSTGVPHILEHLSLCGSAKYPVRDPFFKMLTRSLSTFMNAFTASDWTMYPFSTQNYQDYQNLMSVYLDAVFYPLLRHLDFCQEGWRLEHVNPDDLSSPVVFKGVVYNEMKGAFSNSQQLFVERTQNFLLPSHTYGVVSGGDPTCIPDLTWNNLKDFHSHHYHPSNSRFYTYGNFPLENHLRQISEHVLDRFETTTVNTAVPLEPRWASPREAVIRCAPDPMNPDPTKQSTVAVTYLLSDITQMSEATALSILGTLLVDGEKAPFYQSLLESGIGSDYAPTTGYNGFMRESTFSVGLQRVAVSDVGKVKEIIDATFDRVIEEGFERERIDAVLHKIEIGLKHQSDKFGLNLGIGLLPCWIHDGNPAEQLQINKHVNWFKQQLDANPKYLQDLVVRYFKNNQHRLLLIMSPDENYNKNCQEAEAEKLNTKLNSLSEAEKQHIYLIGKELKELQSRQEDVSCLPSLQVQDIERNVERVTLITSHSDAVTLHLCSQPTNDVTYFRAVSSIRELPHHLKCYVPLFCDIVTKMGTQSMNYKDLSQMIELKTGAMEASAHITEHHTDANLFEQSILFTSYCLNRNVPDMLHLWSELFNSLSLADVVRLETLVQMLASESSSQLSDYGHRYAMTHAASTLRPCSATRELMSGMTQVGVMKSLAELSDFAEVIGRLKEIAAHVLSTNNLRCFVTSTADNIDSVHEATKKFLLGLPHSHMSAGKNQDGTPTFYGEDKLFVERPAFTHYELPFHVNFTARSLPIIPYSHPDFACLRILANILTTRYLHREIREKGGAYGGGAVADQTGLFHFYAYRDPNLEKTLATFSAAAVWASEGQFTDRDIDEAKLSVFSKVDSPVPPGQKGMRYFLHEISDDAFQKHREQLLAVNRENIVDVTSRYLVGDSRPGSVTVLGPANPSTSDSTRWTVVKLE
jgi:hypothetical protein